MGLVGTVLSAATGAFLAFGLGAASLLRAGAFVLLGAMLLFLALAARGGENRAKRTKLLLLFFLWLLSYFDLPLLCPLCEALVVPLLALLYRDKGDGVRIGLLAGLELVYAVLRTLALTPLLGGYAVPALGLALILVSAARFWVLWALYRRAQEEPETAEGSKNLRG